MHRSVAALALLAVLTLGALLASIVAPAVAGAQTDPAADQVTSTTVAPSTTEAPTTTTVAPSTTEPAPSPTSTVPPASTIEAPPATTQASPAEAAGQRGPRNLSEATYVYTPVEVKRAWNNSHHDKISLAQATRLASYLNAVVEAQIRQYLLVLYLNAVANNVPNQANWDRVAACESGGNWAMNSGNGFYGGLQFSLSTWRSVGGTGLPSQNSRLEQIRRANILKDRVGLSAWPHCGARF